MSDWVDEVLDFWFGLDSERWWKEDPALDEEIRDRFRELRADKRELPAESFLADAQTALAAVVLFDQFPRNMFRGLAEQYATDHLALQVARGALERDFDEELTDTERGILYMPFMHSEDIDNQRRSMLLFTGLGDDYQLGFAKKHHDVIQRFGRFPHRNEVLGREPREDELAAPHVTPW